MSIVNYIIFRVFIIYYFYNLFSLLTIFHRIGYHFDFSL